MNQTLQLAESPGKHEAATMKDKSIYLIYDQECPLCHAYCRVARIQQAVGSLILINAREDVEFMNQVTKEGLDIDQGMVLKIDDQLYYGSDAIHALALLSSRSGLFNRINFWVFKSKGVAHVLYPIMRSGRNLVLKLLGKTKINNLDIENNRQF